MSIAFVNSTSRTGNIFASSAPVIVTYTSTPGNSLFLAITSVNAVSSVVDSNNASWTQLVSTSFNSALLVVPVNIYLYGILNSAAITSVTIHTTAGSSATSDVVLGEYSGVAATVGSATTTTTDSGDASSGMTISQAITANDWLIVVLGTVNGRTLSAVSAGNLRVFGANSPNAANAVLMDNTSATNATVTCTASSTHTTNGWAGVAQEIAPLITPHLLTMMGCGA